MHAATGRSIKNWIPASAGMTFPLSFSQSFNRWRIQHATRGEQAAEGDDDGAGEDEGEPPRRRVWLAAFSGGGVHAEPLMQAEVREKWGQAAFPGATQSAGGKAA